MANLVSDNVTTWIKENKPIEASIKDVSAQLDKLIGEYCCGYTILSKEEFQQNAGWSGGRVPIPVSIPDAYKV
jgi:hypothetical protein